MNNYDSYTMKLTENKIKVHFPEYLVTTNKHDAHIPTDEVNKI